MHAYPHGNVFYRKLTKSFPEIVRGEGCWLEDADGKRYLDAVGGAFVASWATATPRSPRPWRNRRGGSPT